jgi:hypothetical protein
MNMKSMQHAASTGSAGKRCNEFASPDAACFKWRAIVSRTYGAPPRTVAVVATVRILATGLKQAVASGTQHINGVVAHPSNSLGVTCFTLRGRHFGFLSKTNGPKNAAVLWSCVAGSHAQCASTR